MMESTVRTTLLLAIQVALLGAVPPSLRAVTSGWNGHLLKLRFIFDGPIAEDDEEEMREVATNVIASFPAPWKIDEEIIRLDLPSRLDGYRLKDWVYMRREAIS